MKRIAIPFGAVLLFALTGAARADDFNYCTTTANNSGELTSCQCPTNTMMTGVRFTMNGNGDKMSYSLYCVSRCDISLTGSPFNGPDATDNNTGNQTSTSCGPGNVMVGLYFTNNANKFVITPRCRPANPLTQTNPPNGSEATTHNTGDPGTSTCPSGVARGLYSKFTNSAFSFMTLCWNKGSSSSKPTRPHR